MKLSKNALTVLERRYIARDESGQPIEDVEGLFRRVARTVAQADVLHGATTKQVEKTAQRFYDMMTNLDFLPNSPTLMNAGRPLGQLSACFVLPVGDSMEEIFDSIKHAALIHKSGGGTGFSFSRLRSNGSTVQSTGGVASGPVSFMKVFNAATEAVKQGGTRRGANMGILRVDHPDILEFIDCKQDNNDITNFNISIGITEAFMEAVENDREYELINPNTKLVTGTLRAKDVFEKIVNSAWRNGEPGIIFLDRVNRDNIVPSVGEIESTNPCGEQPLLPYESCNLGSINLANFVVKNPDGTYDVDKIRLEETVYDAVHFLDNVIEVNKYPLHEIEEMTKKTRKIGLGVMGFADLLLRLNIAYDSDEGVAMGENLMAIINTAGHDASFKLAETRGSFPLFEESTVAEMYNKHRNGTVTTIAPTGTISIMAGVSSGVEPIFAYAFVRNVMDNDELAEVNPMLRERLEAEGLYSEELMKRIVKEGTLAHIEEIPEEIRRVFVCAHDIKPEAHIKMQAAFQRHTDNAVSKTVNFTNDATVEDVAEVYWLAYKLGCKGTTIYRDGSRDNQTLSVGAPKKAEELPEIVHQAPKPRPRAETLMGITKRMKTGCGNLYVTVNYDELGAAEVFTSTGKAGGCPSQSEAVARLTSIALRSGLDVDYITKQMRGIRCPSTIRQPGLQCTSCPDAIARVVKEAQETMEKNGLLKAAAKEVTPSLAPNAGTVTCPECGEELEHEGGCVSCRNCGYSKCG